MDKKLKSFLESNNKTTKRDCGASLEQTSEDSDSGIISYTIRPKEYYEEIYKTIHNSKFPNAVIIN